ncbi:uncharacterized protein [Oscarella lobularis]|uniref:uncharacterized protein n=1 Tax=Oscarella lobularis TaxID=121494 RepID=UPI003313933D
METNRVQLASPPFKVLIHNGELAQIRQWVLRHQDVETGGDLFGLWATENTAVVQFVLGPGRGSGRTSVSFFQSPGYLKNAGTMLTETHGLCHIGEWHSHHRIGLAEPSEGDQNTVSSNMPQYGWKRFIVFIANIPRATTDVAGLGCFLFAVRDRWEYITMQRGRFEVIPDQSPFRFFLAFSSHFREVICTDAESMDNLVNVDVRREADSARGESFFLCPLLPKTHARESVPLLALPDVTSKEAIYAVRRRQADVSSDFPASGTKSAAVEQARNARSRPSADASSSATLKAVSAPVKARENSEVGFLTEMLDQTKFSNARLWKSSLWSCIPDAHHQFFQKLAERLGGVMAKEPHAVIILFVHRLPVVSSDEYIEAACRLDYRRGSSSLTLGTMGMAVIVVAPPSITLEELHVQVVSAIDFAFSQKRREFFSPA